MQAVYNEAPATLSFPRMHFAGSRDYMMRSEKRRRSGGPAPAGAPRKRPPKRRRKRAGFFYKLLMMILLLVLWPFGLLMLWRRKVRWGVGTKLLVSVVTLAAGIILLGFALTVNTGNADYTALQDKANSFLDVAADALIEAGDVAADQGAVVADGAKNLSSALWDYTRDDLADGVAWAANLGGQARTGIETFIESIGTKETPTEATPTDAVETDEAAKPDATLAILDVDPEVTVSSGEDNSPADLPETSPSAVTGTGISSGILTREGEMSDATVPPTPAPTPESYSFAVKPAAEAVVYYNEGGKCYHMAPACGSMLSADQHTFGDTLESTVRRCTLCSTPDKTILDEEFIVWTDGEKTAHLSDDCTAFTGDWNIVTAAQANADGLTACEECEADRYLKAIADGKPVTVETPAAAEATATPVPTEEQPSEEPSAKPTQAVTAAPTAAMIEPAVLSMETEAGEAPAETSAAPVQAEAVTATAEAEAATVTAAPTAEASAAPTAAPVSQAAKVKPAIPQLKITPTRALKEAGLAQVYLADGMIHRTADCTAITGAAAAATLADCAGSTACETCLAPLAEYAQEHCLWQDESGLCHTGDECALFTGAFSLIPRDAALEQALTGCKDCKASEYLFPNTAINYDGIRK